MRRKDREVTEIGDIITILESCKICHLAILDGDAPYVVPLSYGYDMSDGILTLYFHSAKEGRKIDVLNKNNNVCFEISTTGGPVHSKSPCNSIYYFSSIIGFGKVYFVEKDEEKCRALSKIFHCQTGNHVSFTSQQADSVCIFKIVSDNFSAKRKNGEKQE